MMRLAEPGLLTVGLLFMLPYLLRRHRAWHYSSLRLLPISPRAGLATICISGLTIVSLLLLLLALARPQKPVTQTHQAVEVRDMVLTLDLSLSMEGYIPRQEQQPPHLRKLDLVQQTAMDFVKRHPRDRLALVVFGDEAFGAWPLSSDSTTLQRRLQQLDTLLPPQLRGTNIEKALTRSLDHLQELGQAANKIVLLLTDGLDSIDPSKLERLRQRLHQEQVKLYVLGVQINEASSWVAQLARQAHGQYFAIDKAEDLEAAFHNIEQLEASRVFVLREIQPEDLYHLFAFPGLGLLLVSMICRSVWVLEV
jgi:Ca-activated chloride channel family protein